MTETNTQEPQKKVEAAVAVAPRRDDRDRRGGGRGRPRSNRPSDERRSEFSQKMIGIRRVARVMAGGRRFNFSVGL